MNRKLKHGMSMAIAILSALFINTACTEEWDDHYKDNGTNLGVNGKTSILDKIREDDDLDDFCEVLDSMNIVDKYGKLVNFADSLFNQSRVYTLWAPVDDSFDKEQWLKMLKADVDTITGSMKKPNRDKVLARFVGSHVAEYIKNASGVLEDDNYIYLINQKMIPFVGGKDENATYTFDGIQISEKNIRVSNGLIHKLGGSVAYAPSIWEYIETAQNADSAAQFLYSFNQREFNPNLSIEGPTVNGDITYIDSVFTNSNQWLQLGWDKTTAGFGDITKEDSSYVVFIPSNKVWETMVPKLENYFRFHTAKGSKDSEEVYNIAKSINDSLTAFYARKVLLNYTVFSNNDQPVPGIGHVTPLVRDSLLSTYRGGKRLLFAKSDLMDGVIDSASLSNGTYYLKDNFNYNPFDLWHDTIIVEAENGAYQGITFGNDAPKNFEQNGKGAVHRFVSKNDIHHSIDAENKKKNLMYMELAGSAETSTQLMRWSIPGVLSGSYYVGVVVVPAHIASKDSTANTLSKKNMLTFTLKCNQADDMKAAAVKNLAQVKQLENDPTGIDTVWMTEKNDPTKRMKVKFPYSEYGLTRQNTSVYIEVQNVVPRNTNKVNYDATYDRKLRIDLVILEPVENDEE